MSELKRLEDTLAIYGGDRDRWPEGREVELASVQSCEAGQALVAEADALETVLSSVEVEKAGDMSDLLGNVMAATAEHGVRSPSLPQQKIAVRFSQDQRRGWIAGAAMAAMLVIGVFAGLNGFGTIVTSQGIALEGGAAANSSEDALLADLSFPIDLDLGDDV